MWFCYILGLGCGMLVSYGLGKAQAGEILSVGVGFCVAIVAPFAIANALHIRF